MLLKPGGSFVTRSPWLIQTVWRPCSQTPSSRGDSWVASTSARPIFAVMTGLHFAAKLRRHQLLAVADAEDRHAGLEDRPRGAGRAFFQHRGRTAGQDHRLGLQRGEGRLGLLEGGDLAIDAGLANAAGDQLGHLRAEIDDQHLVVVGDDFVVEGVFGHGLLPAKHGLMRSHPAAQE